MHRLAIKFVGVFNWTRNVVVIRLAVSRIQAWISAEIETGGLRVKNNAG